MGTKHNPLRVARFTDAIWDDAGGDVSLGEGEFLLADTMPCKPMLAGLGSGLTTLVSEKGTRVLAGTVDGTMIRDLALRANQRDNKCNGWAPKGHHNTALRVRAQSWSRGVDEAFTFLPYGDHCKVLNCQGEVLGDYGTVFCALGENPMLINCHAKGQGRRIMGYAVYGVNGYWEHCVFEGVNFGFYGDVGGNPSEPWRATKVWHGNRFVNCRGTAREAAWRVEALHEITYRDFYIQGGSYKAPRWASVFNVVKDDQGKAVGWNTREPGSGWHFDSVEFLGGPHLALALVPGCTVKGCWFEQAPELHEKHKEWLFWGDDNQVGEVT